MAGASKSSKLKGLRQVVYFPPRLHKILRLSAARDNRSRSEIVVQAVEKYFQDEREANGN